MNPEFVCRYLCGICGYDEFDWWTVHQAHYEKHVDEWKRAASD